MTIGLVITAAGKSTRFGSRSKLLSPLYNTPILVHTIRRFYGLPNLKLCVITASEEDIEAYKKIIKELADAPWPILCISGGATRKESVEMGVNHLEGCEKAMIHDAARPNISIAFLNRLIDAGEQYDAVIPGLPVTDTIKRISDQNEVVDTLPREKLVRVQTPQLFQKTLLLKAYRKKLKKECTDEAMIMEANGYPVKVVEGEESNIKITFPEDIERLKAVWVS